jgi:hypothetical protein
MIKHLKYFFFITTFLSCKVVFTEKIRTQIDNNGVDLSKVQFYNSDKIVLKRSLSSEEVKVASGKISVENGKYVEIIKINKKTPGRCNKFDKDHLSISFENGTNRDFIFYNNNVNSDASIYEFKPEELRKIKKTSIELSTDNSKLLPIQSVQKDINECTVFYDNKEYKIQLSTMPYLLVKKNHFTSKSVNRRKVKGIIVD